MREPLDSKITSRLMENLDIEGKIQALRMALDHQDIEESSVCNMIK